MLSDQPMGPPSPPSRPEVFNERKTGLSPWRRQPFKVRIIRHSAGAPRESHLESMVVNSQDAVFLGSVPPVVPGSGLPNCGSGEWVNRLCHRKMGKGTAPRAIRENAALLFTDGLTRVSRDDSRWGPGSPAWARAFYPDSLPSMYADSQPMARQSGGLVPMDGTGILGGAH